MKTRFDDYSTWITANGCVIPISDMETTHLMNTVKMMVKKPHTIMSMLITDVERAGSCCCSNVWAPDIQSSGDVVKQSISNITSMSAHDLIEYALNSPLGAALLKELERRGVNVSNVLEIWSEED